MKEGKIPIDTRVPMTPEQAAQVQRDFPNIEVLVQRNPARCFADAEYEEHGISTVDNVMDCEILMGVKEVPIIELIENRTYFFFSHTIKEQSYNRELLREILRKNIRLIDWECLTDGDGHRLIAFGRYAGIVGAYNALWTFGNRYNLYHVRRAYECEDLADLKKECEKIKLPPIKIAITGGGRVAKGAMEVLLGIGMIRVSPEEFMEMNGTDPIFVQLNNSDYTVSKDGSPFDRTEYFSHPERFDSDFLKYASKADLLINATYWDHRGPKLFFREDMEKGNFKIKIIADISCDIDGSVPSTKQASSIEDPIYDYDPSTDSIRKPFSDEANVTMMAIDNLPRELPKDASKDFGRELISKILPSLLGEDQEGIIERATITKDGKLTPQYAYLEDFVKG